MKKFFLLIVSVLAFAIMLAVPAMAADLTASGYIGVQGEVFKNVQAAASSGRLNEMGAFLGMRARLGFTVRASEDLYGFVFFEMDSNRFGETTTGNASIGQFGADQVAVEVKNVYIDFRIPPKLPIWARVGVQGYSIRPLVFSAFDAAGVSLRTMIDPIKLSATGYYAKALDTDDWRAGDASEFYGIDMNIPITISPQANIKPGMFWFYQTYREGATPAANWQTPPGTHGAPPYGAGAGGNIDNANFWWLGLYANGKIGPFPMEVDFIYQDGAINGTTPANDTAYGSWLIRGWASYVWKNLEVGAGGMYVQGDNASTTDKFEGFVLPQRQRDYPLALDSVVFFGAWMGSNPISHQTGLIYTAQKQWQGFWYARGFAYYKLFPWLKVGAQLMYLGDTVKNGDNTFFGYNQYSQMDADDDSGIGWEMDFGVNLQIYKNLSFNGAFGYLFAQKALSMAGGVAPADPWAFAGVLFYTF